MGTAFAEELNSGNITQAPYSCLTNATWCNLADKGITSIAPNTFINHLALQAIYLGLNQITTINSGTFLGPTSLKELYLSNNLLTSIDTGTINALSGLMALSLGYNYLTTLPANLTTMVAMAGNGLDISYNYLDYAGFSLGLRNFIDSKESNPDWRGSQLTAFSSCASVDIPQAECEDLVDLYNGTNGSNWTNRTKRMIGSVLCEWYGVTCTDGHVTSIDLNTNNLSGSVLLSNLPELTNITLSYNTIPSITLSGLTNLNGVYGMSLNLSSINLWGLDNLLTLELGSNNLSSIDLSEVPSLDFLDLFSNQFTSINLSGLSNLTTLYLYSNQLSTIDLSPLTNVVDIDIDDNQFTGITFPALTSLTTLNLDQNQLTTLDVSPLTNLESLDANYNQLTSINLSGLTHLTRVMLYYNLFSSINPTPAINIENLQINNNLITSLPEGTKNLSSLTTATLTNNCRNIGSMSAELIAFLNAKAGNTGWQTSLNPSCPVVEEENPPPVEINRLGRPLTKDICPNGDLSPSYYDNTCEAAHEAADTCSIENSPYTQEINESYVWACELGITTMPTIQEANLGTFIQRSFLAKMLSEFAMDVLGKTPDTSKSCTFHDIGSLSQELKGYVKLACQLGLMGYEGDGTTQKGNFEPGNTLTRAEFGTILSRLLWGTTYANIEPFYSKHLATLKEASIMMKIDTPFLQEEKAWILLMMQRIANYRQK